MCSSNHAPYASAFALAQRPLVFEMPEAIVSLGEVVPVAPRILPKDPAAAEVAQDVFRTADAVLFAANGIVTVGPDLETAFLRMELVEHYARIRAVMHGPVGAPVPLNAEGRERLLGLRKKAGLHLEGAPTLTATSNVTVGLRDVVAQEVRQAFKGKIS